MTQDSPEHQATPDAYARELTHLRHVISTAKIVVPISAAIAATFVAGTLQVVDPSTHWDHLAGVLMLATLGLTIWVAALRPKTHEHEADREAFEAAKKQTCWAHWLMVAQVSLSVASCIASGLGLLWPCTWQPGQLLPWT